MTLNEEQAKELEVLKEVAATLIDLVLESGIISREEVLTCQNKEVLLNTFKKKLEEVKK